MTKRRMEQGYLAGLLLVTIVATTAFIWPNYRRSAVVSVEIAALEGKIGRLQDAQESLDQQSAAVSALEQQRAQHCRNIPENAQVASLVRVLSLESGGVEAVDQTFKVSGMTSFIYRLCAGQLRPK